MKAKPNGEMMQIFEKAFDMLKENKNSLTYDLEETEMDYMEEDIEKFNGMLHKKGYEVKNGTIVRKNGESRDQVCNFFIMPKCYVHYYDNDFIRTQKVCLKVYCSEEEEVIYILLNTDELGSSAWVYEYLDLEYTLDNDKNYKEIFEMIQIMCRILNKRPILDYYCGTGWMKKYNGKWSYKYGEKSIVNTLSRDKYLFIHLREQYREALSMIEVAPKSVTIPILSFAVLSVLKGILKEASIEPNFVLAVTGNSKKHILRLVGLFTNIFNNDIKERLNWGTYGNITDAPNSVKRKVARFKDSILVIDAYDEASKTLNKSMDQFLANYLEITEYNESAIENNTYALNRLCLLVRSEIVKNDLFCNIGIKDDDIKIEQIKTIQNDNSIVLIFYYMIEALRKELKWNEKDIIKAFKKHFSFYKKRFFDRTLYSERTSEILSWLLIGLKLFLECGRKIDAIPEDEAIRIFNEAISIFSDEKQFGEANFNDVRIISDSSELFSELMREIYYLHEKDKDNMFSSEINEQSSIEGHCIGWSRMVGQGRKAKECIVFNESCIPNIQSIISNSISFDWKLTYDELIEFCGTMKLNKQNKDSRDTYKINGVRMLVIEIEKLKLFVGKSGKSGIWENEDNLNDLND